MYLVKLFFKNQIDCSELLPFYEYLTLQSLVPEIPTARAFFLIDNPAMFFLCFFFVFAKLTGFRCSITFCIAAKFTDLKMSWKSLMHFLAFIQYLAGVGVTVTCH